METLPALLKGLEASDFDTRLASATELVTLVDAAFGVRATAIGSEIRRISGIPAICECVSESRAEMHQKALVVLGNLSSDAFDENSTATKLILRGTGVVASLVPHLRSSSRTTTLYATACLQNMCHDTQLAVQALRCGAQPVLLELVRVDNPMLQKFAAGALHNAARVVLSHVTRGQRPSSLAASWSLGPSASSKAGP